jgi:citronellyl-CoA synthetase
MLAKITEDTAFEGYTSEEESEKKVLRNALEQGDAWFNSGDLMRVVDVGFTAGFPHYQFVDRVGDTFRWKSENVSTNEVGELLNEFDQVHMCNVYGVEVPNADGRAGMAAITLKEGVSELDLEAFSAHVIDGMPAYARPVFLRILPEMDTTGTFKMVKGDLRKQAYHFDMVSDKLYVMKPGSTVYEALDSDFIELMDRGEAGF